MFHRPIHTQASSVWNRDCRLRSVLESVELREKAPPLCFDQADFRHARDRSNLPIAALLFLRAIKSLTKLVRPLATVLPAWLPADHVLSLLLVLAICFLVGQVVRTQIGRSAWERVETSVFQKLPGYVLVRGFAHQLAGETESQAWKPALAEIEQALVPAFIIEDLEDGRFTVFVPSVPTALAGAVYILNPDRVHPLDISFTRALRIVSQWGLGSKDLVAAMDRATAPASRATLDVVRARTDRGSIHG